MSEREPADIDAGEVLARLSRVIESRADADPETSYVASLLRGDESKVLKKIGEESVEFVLAVRDGDQAAMVHEAADLWFHTLVALGRQGVDADRILRELARRFGISGHEEKSSRQR